MPALLALVTLLGLVGGTLAAGPAVAAPPAPTSAAAVGLPTGVPAGVVVSPDPSRDLYTGTGGLVIPARHWQGGDAARAGAAACGDCQWRVSVLCTKADLAAGRCRSLSLGCPVGTVAVRVWLSRAGGPWEVVGETCQGDQPPRTVSEVGTAVRDRAVALLPPLRAAVQPAAGALVGLPAVFRTGQPAAGLRGADLSVLGLDVRLGSRVTWQWDYGDGAGELTAQPGGAWPDLSVSHTYRRAGTWPATVLAVWRAQYTVEGLGPFVVPGPALAQSARVDVVVRAARARLVG